MHLHRRFVLIARFLAWHLDSWWSTLGGFGYKGLQDWDSQYVCPYQLEIEGYFLECRGRLNSANGLLGC